MTLRTTALAALFLLPLCEAALAQERVTLGWGRMFSNDGIGDTKDRWRTGAYTISRLRGPSWSGELPAGFGEILELRLRTEMIAPANLSNPAAGDRRYAGLVTLGLHTHFDWQGIETSLGTDLTFSGPQTGIGRFQSALHDLLDTTSPDPALDNQIADGVHPTLVVELGRSIALGGQGTIRPFAEAQAGLETFVRVGADLSFGGYTQGALMLREQTTGQRYRGVRGDVVPGFTFTLGGDIAKVFESDLLPEGGAADLAEERSRLRAGLAWQGDHGGAVFYGLTWLSKEYEGQPEGQVLGSLNFNLSF